MKKNQLFIILGAIIFLVIICLLFWMQSSKGDANEFQNKYKITIHNCSSAFKDTVDDLKEELKALLKATDMKKDGIFIIPIVSVMNQNKIIEFGIPTYGMNYMRYSTNPDMYLYSDRMEDESEFFANDFNAAEFQKLKKLLLKPLTKDIPNLKGNQLDTFVIDRTLSFSTKEKWNSMKSLRPHLDSLIQTKKIKNGASIHVYYLCEDEKIEEPLMETIEEVTQEKIGLPVAEKQPKVAEPKNEVVKKSSQVTDIRIVDTQINWSGELTSLKIRLLSGADIILEQSITKTSQIKFSKAEYTKALQSSTLYVQYFNPEMKKWLNVDVYEGENKVSKLKCFNLK